MNNSSFRCAFACRLAVAGALLLPYVAQAQVGYVADLALSNLCLAQNWDTPVQQGWLKRMDKQERMQLFGGIHVPLAAKRCLIKKKPASVGLCNQALASFADMRTRNPVGGGQPFQDLSAREQERMWAAFGNSGCMGKDGADSDDDWVPKDLLPDLQTVQLLARAERGDIEAQMAAHDLYVHGLDVPVSERRANFWLARAAKGGHAEAQYLLGWKYSRGKAGDGVDFSKSIHFLKMAARQGHPQAMTLLGDIHEQPSSDGIGMAPEAHWDMKQAIDWYTKAANLG